MIKEKVALVLGAGSSIPFGYPVGGELRRKIIELNRHHSHMLAIEAGLFDWSDGSVNIHTFVGEFAKSQMTSIDAFLARRPQFSEIGKLAIAALLLTSESQSHLFECEHADLWQRYLFGKLATEKWEDLDFSNLSVVTFNYDRSFEHYLISALEGSYGKSQEEVVERLRTLNIVHVYGSLGPTMPGDPGYFYYGSPASRSVVQEAAKYLKVIPEGRDDDDSLKKARNILQNADAIGFLGFGFDETNLRRLDARNTCSL